MGAVKRCDCARIFGGKKASQNAQPPLHVLPAPRLASRFENVGNDLEARIGCDAVWKRMLCQMQHIM